jgi:hypothetical protein
MCGGGGSDATDKQIAYEQQRQAQIDSAVGSVNNTYDSASRQKSYTDFLAALRKQYTTDATEQKQKADRNLKFSLARNGLTGGSAAVDLNRVAGQEFNKGLVTAENKAQSGLAALKSQDEASRASLISQVQSGLGITDATQRAQAGTATALQAAQADALSGGLGDIFGTTAKSYKDMLDASNKRKELLAAAGYYGK